MPSPLFFMSRFSAVKLVVFTLVSTDIELLYFLTCTQASFTDHQPDGSCYQYELYFQSVLMIQVTLHPLINRTGEWKKEKWQGAFRDLVYKHCHGWLRVHGNFVHKLRSTTTKWVAFKIFRQCFSCFTLQSALSEIFKEMGTHHHNCTILSIDTIITHHWSYDSC